MDFITKNVVAAQLTTALYQKKILMKLNNKKTTIDDITIDDVKEVIEIWLNILKRL
jgi:hypothetical protein